MKKCEKIEPDYKALYLEMVEKNKILEEELAKKDNATGNMAIIKRLDIIGNILGDYVKKEELKESKEKLDKIKNECEMLNYDYNSREMQYSNRYEDMMKWQGDRIEICE